MPKRAITPFVAGKCEENKMGVEKKIFHPPFHPPYIKFSNGTVLREGGINPENILNSLYLRF